MKLNDDTYRKILENLHDGLYSIDRKLSVRSLGATLARGEDTIESLVKRADTLSTSISRGRNRLTFG